MAWTSYSLDQKAQQLVLDARQRDRDAMAATGKRKNSLNQSFKMRESVAYGLERFWGEHLRLQLKEPDKSQYWKETWNALVEVMQQSGITVPNDPVQVDNTRDVKAMAQKLWQINKEDQRIILAVLTQLCDCIVWWTQRYKGSAELNMNETEDEA